MWETDADASGRTELIEAALAIADAEGLDAVSIRHVAARVGRRPMSVYSHVASKDDLVALMFERISGELIVPEPTPADGRAFLAEIAHQAFRTYLAHPWMLHAFGRRPPPGPNQLRRAEQSATAVQALGVDRAHAWQALSIVHEWTMGHALHVVTLRENHALELAMLNANHEHHPNAFAALQAKANDDAIATFEHALETVLDGIEGRSQDGP
jgi:AcrR family transcriptional regulator